MPGRGMGGRGRGRYPLLSPQNIEAADFAVAEADFVVAIVSE